MTRQRKLDLHLFSGRERNECAQGHSAFTDVYAVAADFGSSPPDDDNGNGDRATEIAPPLSQDQPIRGSKGVANGLQRKRPFESKTGTLPECSSRLRTTTRDRKRDRCSIGC